MLSDIFILCIFNLNSVLFWYILISISGAKKVVASKYVKNRQMNKDDNRSTIKIARCGLAYGADGPWLFLVKADIIYLDTFKGGFQGNTALLLVPK